MSVYRALYLRWKFYMKNGRMWLAYAALPLLFLWALSSSFEFLVEKSAQSPGEIVHEEQIFPMWNNFDFMMDLAEGFRVVVFPKNKRSIRLMSLVQEYSKFKVNVEFGDSQSAVRDVISLELVRIVFDEISQNNLDYTIFIRNDSVLFMSVDDMTEGGPSTIDNFLWSKGHSVIQVAVDKAYMEMYGVSMRNWSICKNPYPKYSWTTFPPTVGKLVVLLFWTNVCFSSLGLVGVLYGLQVIEEKSTGLGEILAIYGVSRFHSQISWFCTFALILLAMSLVQTALMVRVFLKTSAWIVALVLVTYYFSFLVFATALSSFCSNPITWKSVISFAWVAMYYLVRLMDLHPQNNFVLFLASLLPMFGLHQCFKAVYEFENLSQGVQMENFFTQPPVTYNLLSVGDNIIIMVFGSFLLWGIFIYFDSIIPRKYGITKSWYFICPFLPKIFKSQCFTRKSSAKADTSRPSVREEVKDGTPVAVEVQKIHKSYGRINALNGVSLNIYANQITALLGENGAGKTTLIGILTGMLKPTKGTILVSGQDISEGDNLEKFRRKIGYCPQDDILMDYMTVHQHLIFYSVLQGTSYREAHDKSVYWLDLFNISDKKDVHVRKLSGGMKRKLSLCICFARDPIIVFLDEPTSGLDPVARREVWNILSSRRGERAVILTTHRMEEADALSDYIAILSEGNLSVFGSNEFLKSKYGTGYQVSVVSLVEDLKISEEFLDTMRTRFVSTSVINKSDKNLVLGVKSSDSAEVLRFIERTFGNKVGISVTSGTIDDVFVQLHKEDVVQTSVDETAMPTRNDPLLVRIPLVVTQFKHLIGKRYFWARRKWKTLILYILVFPAVASTFAMILPMILHQNLEERKVVAELRSFGETKSFISENETNNELSNIIKSLISLQGGTYYITEMVNQSVLLGEAVNNLKLYRTQIIFSADLQGDVQVYYSSVATNAMPTAINMITNALIQVNGSQKSVKTRISWQPSFELVEKLEQLAVLIRMLAMYGFCSMVEYSFSYFLLFQHAERIAIMKHLQLMTGLHPIVYWAANFLVDTVLVLLAVAVMMIVFFFWESTIAAEPLFTQRPYFEVSIIILISFGLSAVSFAYLCSFCFKKEAWSLELYLLTSALSFVLYYFLLLVVSYFESTSFLVTKLKYIFYLIPSVPFIESFKTTLPLNKLFYMDHDTRAIFAYDEVFGDLITDISLEIIYLIIDSVLGLILIIIIDDGSWKKFRIFRNIKNGLCCLGCCDKPYDESKVDTNVLEERKRIQNLKGDNEPFLVVDSLTKFYRKRMAANGVSFTVDRGECFGLLGLNGAGKTTTFRMLTGLVDSSTGSARIEGNSLQKKRRKYMKSLGFCPQSEGLLEPLTGKELLRLFGALRGLNGDDLKTAVEKWVKILGMENISDRRCGYYSGGSKRKLSFAMALIGDPNLVFLDEPTTGIDPVARRKLWSMLRRSQEAGTTFVLSTHNIDESEALCNRVTIMAAGYMKCLGPINQLKIDYAAGFKLTIRMNKDCTSDEKTRIKESVDSSFRPSYSLIDEQLFVLTFDINKKDLKWSERFDLVNKLKSRFPEISDIVITDSSLERVFLNVANPQ